MQKNGTYSRTGCVCYIILSMSVEIIFKIAAIGILITVICQILKKSDRDDIATLVAVAGLVIVLTMVVTMVFDLFDQLKQLFELY